jgi:alpha-tubulin suppressor-like RCC1 family protein
LANWSAISTSSLSAVSIKTDGTLWTWGNNSVGQLGLNNITSYSSPKQVGALTNWLKIAGSYTIAGVNLVIKSDGTLWGWGGNSLGQLGLGNRVNYSSPKQIGALTNWLNIASGYQSAFATKTDGTLWSWGSGGQGVLGLGNTTNYSSPKQVGALTNWLTVAAGYYCAYAVKTDGTLWAWGSNTYGQLGLGNTTSYNSPKQVGALTTWSKVTGGTYVGAAIKTDGTLWTWGNNTMTNGMLGLGNNTNYSSPKQVGNYTTWKSVGAGQSYILAIATT